MDIHSPKILDEFDYGGSVCFKYVHNGPFNEPASFDIPGLIYQAKVTKFGTKVGLNILININSGFFHIQQKKILVNFCSHFATSHTENHHQCSHVHKFFTDHFEIWQGYSLP